MRSWSEPSDPDYPDPLGSFSLPVSGSQRTTSCQPLAPAASITMADPASHKLTRRQWLARSAAGGVLLGMGSIAYAWRVEPHWVSVCHQRMPLNRLPSRLVGKRLVQISDLHVGPVVDNTYLRGVLRRLPELKPDYLVLTGDLMTCSKSEQVAATIDTLREAPIADVPTISILGNHDYGEFYRDLEVAARLTDGLDSLGIQVLRNRSISIDGLQFAGCEDFWSRQASLTRTLADLDLQKPAICLAHNPDLADRSGWGAFSGWILSGHTHGGQCRLPLLGAPVLPVDNKRYDAGHFRLNGGRDLYINRGLGYKRRVRFGVRPEVTVFTLEAKSA